MEIISIALYTIVLHMLMQGSEHVLTNHIYDTVIALAALYHLYTLYYLYYLYYVMFVRGRRTVVPRIITNTQ